MSNIFDNIAKQALEEIFETLLTSPGVRIERIVSHGQSSPENYWYDQPEHEWILVLSGKAALRFENEAEDRVLTSGDYLNIPARVRHRVEWTSTDAPTIWLAIFY